MIAQLSTITVVPNLNLDYSQNSRQYLQVSFHQRLVPSISHNLFFHSLNQYISSYPMIRKNILARDHSLCAQSVASVEISTIYHILRPRTDESRMSESVVSANESWRCVWVNCISLINILLNRMGLNSVEVAKGVVLICSYSCWLVYELTEDKLYFFD